MHIVQMSFPDDVKARSKSLEYHKEIFSAVRDKDPKSKGFNASTSWKYHVNTKLLGKELF